MAKLRGSAAMLNAGSGESLELAGLITDCASGLRPRLERILTLRLGLAGEEPQTLQQIAEPMRLTRERIRQIQEKAFRMLAVRARRRLEVDAEPGPERKLRALVIKLIRPDQEGAADRAVALAKAVFGPRALAVRSKFLLRIAGITNAETRKSLPAALESSNLPLELRSRSHADFHRRIGRFIVWPVKLWGPRGPFGRGRAREINELGARGIKGQFESTKLGRLVACESRAERAFFMQLESYENVVYYQEQPFAVPYAFEGRSYHYYPDVLFVLDDGRAVVAEIKTKSDFGQIRDLVKWAALWDFCRRNGYGLYLGDGIHSFQTLVSREFPTALEALLLRDLRIGAVFWQRYLQLVAASGVGPAVPTPLVLRHRLEWRLRPFELRAAGAYAPRFDQLYAALGVK